MPYFTKVWTIKFFCIVLYCIVLHQGETVVMKSQAKLDSLVTLHVTMWLKRIGENEVECTQKAKFRKIESMAVGEARKAILRPGASLKTNNLG